MKTNPNGCNFALRLFLFNFYFQAAIIKRNIVYIPASDRYTWYYIEVKRVANTVQVSVVQRQTLGGEGARDVDEPTQVVVGEPDVSSDVVKIV